MPYIIITTKHAGDPEAQASAHERIAAETGSKRALAAAEACRDGSIYVSRRAVATLDEARACIRDHVVRAGVKHGTTADPITPQGGTVGPLPDGSLITVEQTGFHALREAVGWGSAHPQYHDAILTAYNAAQN